MHEVTAVPLNPRLFEMDGISKRQIEEHSTLYQGYVAKTNEIRAKLEGVDRSKANQSYSDVRELKVELSFAWNGVKLHEYYFENLGGKGGLPGAATGQALEKAFGSVERWVEDVKASGHVCKGLGGDGVGRRGRRNSTTTSPTPTTATASGTRFLCWCWTPTSMPT